MRGALSLGPSVNNLTAVNVDSDVPLKAGSVYITQWPDSMSAADRFNAIANHEFPLQVEDTPENRRFIDFIAGAHELARIALEKRLSVVGKTAKENVADAFAAVAAYTHLAESEVDRVLELLITARQIGGIFCLPEYRQTAEVLKRCRSDRKKAPAAQAMDYALEIGV